MGDGLNQLLGLVVYALLIIYVGWDSMRAKGMIKR